MLFQPLPLEFDFAIALFWFLSIGGTVALPILAGAISASRSSWVSFELGVFIGMGVALAGTLAHMAFVIVAARLITHHDDYFQVNILACTSLVLVLAIQIALLVGLIRLIGRRRDRSWGIRRL